MTRMRGLLDHQIGTLSHAQAFTFDLTVPLLLRHEKQHRHNAYFVRTTQSEFRI